MHNLNKKAYWVFINLKTCVVDLRYVSSDEGIPYVRRYFIYKKKCLILLELNNFIWI